MADQKIPAPPPASPTATPVVGTPPTPFWESWNAQIQPLGPDNRHRPVHLDMTDPREIKVVPAVQK